MALAASCVPPPATYEALVGAFLERSKRRCGPARRVALVCRAWQLYCQMRNFIPGSTLSAGTMSILFEVRHPSLPLVLRASCLGNGAAVYIGLHAACQEMEARPELASRVLHSARAASGQGPRGKVLPAPQPPLLVCPHTAHVCLLLPGTRVHWAHVFLLLPVCAWGGLADAGGDLQWAGRGEGPDGAPGHEGRGHEGAHACVQAPHHAGAGSLGCRHRMPAGTRDGPSWHAPPRQCAGGNCLCGRKKCPSRTKCPSHTCPGSPTTQSGLGVTRRRC